MIRNYLPRLILAVVLTLALLPVVGGGTASAAISDADITQPTTVYPARVAPGASVAVNGTANDNETINIDVTVEGGATYSTTTAVTDNNWQAIFPDDFVSSHSTSKSFSGNGTTASFTLTEYNIEPDSETITVDVTDETFTAAGGETQVTLDNDGVIWHSETIEHNDGGGAVTLARGTDYSMSDNIITLINPPSLPAGHQIITDYSYLPSNDDYSIDYSTREITFAGNEEPPSGTDNIAVDYTYWDFALADSDVCNLSVNDGGSPATEFDSQEDAIVCSDTQIWINPHMGENFGNTPDACAGCHRAHTAKGEKLLKVGGTIDAFCYSCHESGTGAYTDVANGLYLGAWDGTTNAGLRGGGFDLTKMDPSLSGTPGMASVTSAHMADDVTTGTLWGSGEISGTDNPGEADFALGCTDCHNPHGNASYRILRPRPIGGYNNGDDSAVVVPNEAATTYTISYYSTTNHRDSSYTPEDLGEWCAQCHTRYLAGGGAGHTHSGDSIFSYRHNTSGTFLSCTRCHVAHGTSATMGTYSGAVAWPGSVSGPTGDLRSSLLHSNNRGVCARCHVDNDGQIFMHGNGGEGEGCESCHGHGDSYGGNSYYGTTQSHGTHTDGTAKGPDPALACDVCHNTSSYPDFADSATLSGTGVCDTCHSPGGSYDGVDDPIIGAKNNWDDGVYGSPLKAGKEQWCAGCHDDVPANSMQDGTGTNAPNVIGDEDEATSYGTGWGFYKTGHGLPNTDNYDASLASGAGAKCTDCHDTDLSHIDNNHRTYVAPSSPGTDLGETYQQGYRLKSISGGIGGDNPMYIPLDKTAPGGIPPAAEDYALCFSCHTNTDPFLDDTNMLTNFRDDTASRNDHEVHLATFHGPGASQYSWDSDWSLDDGVAGNDGDSDMSCPACHNVHGSPSPQMLRHGELISSYGTNDKVPSLDFSYLPAADTTLPDSTGGEIVGDNSPGPGMPSKNGVCQMCHRTVDDYTRTPIMTGYPLLSDKNPVHSAVNVLVDSDITFTLSDSDEGVDWSTFSIQLTGHGGYTQTYTELSPEVSQTGSPTSYAVTVNPGIDFGNAEVITVTINVDDLAIPANSLIPPLWSFTTIV